MFFMEQLLEYSDVIGHVLIQGDIDDDDDNDYIRLHNIISVINIDSVITFQTLACKVTLIREWRWPNISVSLLWSFSLFNVDVISSFSNWYLIL